MDPPEAAQDLFGRLLVRAGYLSPDELEQVLAQQQQERARGAGRRLGAMLLELGAVSDSQVARALATQRRSRGEPGPAPASLTRGENELLGRILGAAALLDSALLARLVALREEAAGRGEQRRLGELLLDHGMLASQRLLELADRPEPAEAELPPADQALYRRFVEESERPVARFRLRVLHSRHPEARDRACYFDEGREVAIGRDRAISGLYLPDPQVSSLHARARVEGDVLELVDLGSRNGTFVGPRRIERARLLSGQHFRAGETYVGFFDTREGSLGTSTMREILAELGIEAEVGVAGAPDEAVDTPASIAGARAVLREFHLRDKQLRAPTATVAPSRSAPGASHQPIQGRPATRPGRRLAAALLVLALAGTLLAPRLLRRPPAAPHVPRERRVPFDPPPAGVLAAPPGVEGQRAVVSGVVLAVQEYRGPHGPTGFDVLLRQDGRIVVLQGSYRRSGLARRRQELPLEPGAAIEAEGVVRRYAGRPAPLPDGRNATHYLELERYTLR